MSVNASVDLVDDTTPAPRLVSPIRHLGAPRTSPADAPVPRAQVEAQVVAALIPADQVPDGATVLGTLVLGPDGPGETAGDTALTEQDPLSSATADDAVRIDLDSRTVLVAGRPLTLTRLEFDLLALLAGTPRRVHTRAQLHASVWEGVSSGGPRTVDVHVHRLRHKLGPVHEQHLVTVRGIGYRWDPSPALAAARYRR